MAKAKKKAAAKKAPAKAKKAPARVTAPDFMELTGTQPKADMTAGCYIRSLVMQDKHSTAKILELVHKHYPDSTAKGGDVTWNRLRLKQRGHAVPAAIREKKVEVAA